MIDYKELSKLTHEAICDPKIGDRFQEMFSYWMEVEDVSRSERTGEPTGVTFRELRTGKTETLTLEQYRKLFHYNSNNMRDMCWVTIDRRAGRKIEEQ